MTSITTLLTALALATAVTLPAAAQPAAPPAYGPEITLEQAIKAATAAAAEARKNNWFMAIAVVSPSGHLVLLHKLDNTQYASIRVAEHKARVAATFKRPTKAIQDGLSATPPNLFLLTIDDVIASEGGVPIIVDGKIIGAIGASGGTSQQDGVVAGAGAVAAAAK